MYYEVKNKPIDLNFVKQLRQELDIPYLVGACMSARGVKTLDSAMNYLEPGDDLFDPFLLKDMRKGVDRVIEAIKKHEKIFICGDYDVDGITSTAILLRFFRHINFPVYHQLPSQTEGHGLSVASVDRIKEKGGKVIITVDNGSSCFDAINHANSLSIDVIVTDHHDISNEGVPAALAIINPKQKDCPSPFKLLSGGGIALFLARGIARQFKNSSLYLTKDLYVLASISTVADVVPLYGDNRKIVKFGLENFFNSGIAGLHLLIEKESKNGHNFSSRDLAFKIAPKINAAGKFGFADDAISLLTENNYMTLSKLLKKILGINASRRALVSEVIPELIKQAQEHVDNGEQVIIVSSDHNSAVNGMMASRLVEQFNKPTIIISFNGDEDGRASCRSIDGFNIQEAIEALQEYHLGGGGHYMAAGLAIRKDQLEAFRVAMNVYAKERLNNKKKKTWLIDGEVDSNFLNQATLRAFQMMEPFGAKNENPMLKIRGVTIDKSPDFRTYINSCRLGEMSVKVYKNLEGTMAELPLEKPLNLIAELSSEEGNPILILKDFEIVE
jgi:single-stranded-DNA-specific exonuclease